MANYSASPSEFSINKLSLAVLTLFASLPVLAQQQASETSEDAKQKTPAKQVAPGQKPANSDKTVQKVTITGGRDENDSRRYATAAKMIFGREELDRVGDSSLGEVLKRLPGVTMGGRPGRGGEIRMRGMGSGYTQILINGERAPRGFSMDSLSPDQVERIEVIRGTTAEFSTQAIAGTINIVLREEYRPKTTDLKASANFEQGRPAGNVSLSLPGDWSDLHYVLNINVGRNRQHDESFSDALEQDGQGVTQLIQHTHEQSDRHSTSLHISPRFSYRFEDGANLNLQPFFMMNRSDSHSAGELNEALHLPGWLTTPAYAFAVGDGEAENQMLRFFGNYQKRFATGGSLQVRFGGGNARMDSHTLRQQTDATGKVLDFIEDTNNTHDKTLTLGGKLSMPWGEAHTWAIGWDFEAGQRNQTRISLDNGKPQFAESGDNLDARTRRFAVFAQDEFELSKNWSAYAGLRYEQVATQSQRQSVAVDNTSRVWSPVFHTVWRLPDTPRDQIRLSLTHSYRAPALNDLIALPSVSNLNSPTRPDRTGNPDLKPELSRGIDLAFEHYLSRAGILSANFFVRDIQDLIRRRTVLTSTSTGQRWVSAPINISHAQSRGLELEAKFQWQEFFPEGPAIDFRANFSRFWSNVDDIPGPNNRLDQQPGMTGNLGFDYRPAGVPLTLGANLNWTPAYQTQVSANQTSDNGLKRQIDAFLLWKLNAQYQLRFSANNLAARDYVSGSSLSSPVINRSDQGWERTYTTWGVRFEAKI